MNMNTILDTVNLLEYISHTTFRKLDPFLSPNVKEEKLLCT
jgi:hypothetical protein